VRHAVELALRTWPKKTQREIAAQVGCDFGYVSKIKGGLLTSQQLDAPTTVTGKDGKTYPTSKPRKQAVDVAAEEVVRTEEPMTPAQNKAFREQAFNAARSAISRLQEIAETNPFRAEAIHDVENWINFNR